MESFASSTSSAERGKYYFVAKPLRICENTLKENSAVDRTNWHFN